jgi:hypothetical protein
MKFSMGGIEAGNWQRPRSDSFRSSSNGGAVGSIPQGISGIIRTESCCTHTSHFTHRRSSSMHDVAPLGGQLFAARPATSAAMAISGLNPRPAGKAGFVPCFQDDSQQWSPPRLRAAVPSARRVPAVSSPLQATSCSLWEESDDPELFRASGVQSMRYDRLQSAGPGGVEVAGKEEKELQSQSVREGAAHAQAIAAMAKAYAEKYGVAQAVVECVACGRGLGVIVAGTSPGSYDSSFCRACRPPAVPPPSSSSWKKGMMHYCRKLLLRMGKKPSHKYTMV